MFKKSDIIVLLRHPRLRTSELTGPAKSIKLHTSMPERP